MKKKINLWALVSVLLLFATCLYRTTERAEGTTSVPIIFFSPTLISYPSVGATFSISVKILNVTDLYSWEFKLYYENIPLNATGVTEGDFLKSGGSTRFQVLQFDDAYNATHGIVWVNCTLLNVPNGVNGSGSFSKISFECVDGGESRFALSDTKLSDSHGNPILHSYLAGVVKLLGSSNPSKTFGIPWEGKDYQVTTYSNSTVARLEFNESLNQIGFYVNGISDTTGFCNITIPKALLHENFIHPWTVLIDGSETTYVKSENTTHTSLYLTYNHSTHRIRIVGAEALPEFPSAIIIPLLIILIALVIIFAKKAPPEVKLRKKFSNYQEEKKTNLKLMRTQNGNMKPD